LASPLTELLNPDVRWRLGTAGYAYPDWRSSFYPRGTPQSGWLKAYAERFPAVEMNTTFHALPDAERLRRWVEQVPADFRFSVKVGRQVTHDTPIDRAGPYLDQFCQGMAPLLPRLGPLLLQFPPTFEFSSFEDLRKLLQRIPSSFPFAVEVRHPSWLRSETWSLLKEYRAAFVSLDHDDHPEFQVVRPTGPLLYNRLIGKHGRYDSDREEQYDPTINLMAWQDRLGQADLTEVKEIWVIFSNDYAGHAPATLRRFAELAGVVLPEQHLARQKTLF